jgi:hypothetical protein
VHPASDSASVTFAIVDFSKTTSGVSIVTLAATTTRQHRARGRDESAEHSLFHSYVADLIHRPSREFFDADRCDGHNSERRY